MQDGSELEIWTVATTVATEADAHRLARELVELRLAACVQVEPIASFYRWQGRLCQEAEYRVTAKTLRLALEPIRAHFGRHHPYEVPQFAAAPVQASPAYAAWVRAEVALPG